MSTVGGSSLHTLGIAHAIRTVTEVLRMEYMSVMRKCSSEKEHIWASSALGRLDLQRMGSAEWKAREPCRPAWPQHPLPCPPTLHYICPVVDEEPVLTAMSETGFLPILSLL